MDESTLDFSQALLGYGVLESLHVKKGSQRLQLKFKCISILSSVGP